MYVIEAVRQIKGAEVRRNLRRYRSRVQGGETIEVCIYGKDSVGYLVPLRDVSGRTEEISIQDFRTKLTDCYERLATSELDAFVVTFHRKPRIGFVRQVRKI